MVILTIDDEENIRNGLADNFALEGYDVKQAASGEEGLKIIAEGGIDLVITDLRMDGISGSEVVKKVTSEHPGIPIIVLTGHGSIDDATAALKAGAFDFLTKPLDLDHLNKIVKNALQGKILAEQNRELQAKLLKSQNGDEMVGKSDSLNRVRQMISKAAPARASVLITGESGVGKELVARAVHEQSDRAKGPFIVVHCAALSETLIESELFGFEKGAFTGAENLHKGRFELADGGTIFLDEIGEVNLATQVKLLRVLQEHKFERVGGEKSIEVDVRVVAATNRNLEEEVKQGRFREDLFYRLNVVHLEVPPLRERKDDIPLLIDAFLKEFSAENGREIKIDSKAKSALLKFDWPGNIRQLRHCIEGASVMCSDGEIRLEDLGGDIGGAIADESISVPLGITLDEAERIIIEQNLAANKGNKSKTAEILGIERKTLSRKLGE